MLEIPADENTSEHAEKPVERNGGVDPVLSEEDNALDPILHAELLVARDRLQAIYDEGIEPILEEAQRFADLFKPLIPKEEELLPEEQRMQEDLEAMRRRGEEEAAQILQELLASLPSHLSSLSYVDALPFASPFIREEFSKKGDVKAAGELGARMASRGLRPASFYETLRLFKQCIDRLVRYQRQCEREKKSLKELEDGSYLFPRELFMGEIRGCLSNCAPEAAEPTYAWIMEVLKERPDFCSGYIARETPEGFAFRPVA